MMNLTSSTCYLLLLLVVALSYIYCNYWTSNNMIVSQYTTSTCCQKSEGNRILLREIHEHAVGNDDNNVACDADEHWWALINVDDVMMGTVECWSMLMTSGTWQWNPEWCPAPSQMFSIRWYRNIQNTNTFPQTSSCCWRVCSCVGVKKCASVGDGMHVGDVKIIGCWFDEQDYSGH